ncbi:NUDIX domain-containing protein [Tenggerimyces flavus]|uniref:8-oxo-dGTP diphosphatase n=1 Tax=Tenggerimyces flavus TaxID=1708749 RepID=A0ABV7YHE0_9ACTN|nr:NUDIX domain-containing protein [Tenggerimyces flavus]MBM7790958.1 mutator protein MutT [Tenggerimyces flavus]
MQIVVGAAIVRAGELLACRRSTPAEVAGGWELPGGKVEPGEDERAALVRECREELGCAIIAGERLGPDVPIGDRYVLRAYHAHLAPESKEPAPGPEHDQLRWLQPEQLDEVDWLPADRPLITELADSLLDGDQLAGGQVGGAVRIGDTVRRPVGPWTPTIHALLAHLAAENVTGIPRVHGIDARGREILELLPGRTTGNGRPPWADADELLADVGRWLATYHEAVRTFRPESPVWRSGARPIGPDELVCHNDLAPYNVVATETDPPRLHGVLDWDVAGPGKPIDDVAFAAWSFVAPYDAKQGEAARRLHVLAEAYGRFTAEELLEAAPIRMNRALERIRAGAARGDEGMQRLIDGTEVRLTEERLARLEIRTAEIRAAL